MRAPVAVWEVIDVMARDSFSRWLLRLWQGTGSLHNGSVVAINHIFFNITSWGHQWNREQRRFIRVLPFLFILAEPTSTRIC